MAAGNFQMAFSDRNIT